jgi:hypothetical protein
MKEGFERHPAVSHGRRYVLVFLLERLFKTSSEFMEFARKGPPMTTSCEKVVNLSHRYHVD